jgi:hypothetical protein
MIYESLPGDDQAPAEAETQPAEITDADIEPELDLNA